MKEYMIYTTNDTEPFIVKTDEDLQDMFECALGFDRRFMNVAHEKDLTGMGTYQYNVVLNVDNIVSISTREKVE